MRVKIEYVVEVDDSFRREIRAWYGREGLATRDEVKDWFHQYGESMDTDLSVTEGQREEMALLHDRESI